MPRPHETNEIPFQIGPEIATPDRHRPPQLNETVSGCGCRCGSRGTSEEGDGGSNEEDNASTLVASDFDSEDEFPPSSDGPERHVNVSNFQPSTPDDGSQRSEVPTRFGLFENGVEGFRLSPHMIEIDELPVRLHRVHSLQDDMADSMRPEPHSSIDHSVTTSDSRSVSRMSPGPGMDVWALEDLRLNDYHYNKYHFLVRPLRLTPQLRYCRGLVTSHLVVPDESSYGRGG